MKLAMATSPGRIPISTYRLQFNRSCTFADATRIVPYLHALGISDLYASSYLKAAPGSLHGYDLVDPTSLNPELGTEKDYAQLVETLKSVHMGQLLDIVPNHMGISKAYNAWWQDVLENGPASTYAKFFDIDWHPVKAELENKVLLPILGDLYGVVLENQEIRLAYADGRFFVAYADHTLPLAPRTWVRILLHRLESLLGTLGQDHTHVQELQSIITALEHLPPRSELDPQRVAERYREQEIAKKRLARLLQERSDISRFVQENVDLFNGRRGDSKSFDLLDALLNDQAYRLAYWRVAAEEINYRRFFDINELAAIHMEEPVVFHEAHQLIFRLLKEGAVTGLRIDHVDGLYAPGDYLRQLQQWAKAELPSHGPHPLFIVVEKILTRGETLPEDWPVYGTTGYEYLNALNHVFIDPTGQRTLDDVYALYRGQRIAYDDLGYECKRAIMRVSMASEINVLGHELNRLSEQDRRSRDFTLNSLIHTIREIIACFPVYRTYITEGPEPVSDRDQAYIRLAVAKAKRRNPMVNSLVFDFVRDLLLKHMDQRLPQSREALLRFVMKFQQTTSPVMAKGLEDTAFYLYNRLVSLNEVGGDPDQFGFPLPSFDKAMRERQARWPHSLSATSTHDTKRSEDVRARINILSEIPQVWKTQVSRWSSLNRKHKTEVEGELVPERNEEYLFYQTLLGVWPLGPVNDDDVGQLRERLQAYMMKALREGKVHTSWMNPNEVYEQAVMSFIASVLEQGKRNVFLQNVLAFQPMIAEFGLYNSLSQLMLKMTCPGVPDFYQGTELWDFSLVDPDNRRPVDFALRAQLLSDLQKGCAAAGADRRPLARELLAARQDGRIKLYITMTALNYRKLHPELFQQGEYVPLATHGTKREHVYAYTRLHSNQAVVVVVPRLIAKLIPDAKTPPIGAEVWGDTKLIVPSWREGSLYRNLFTGETLVTEAVGNDQSLPAGQVLSDFPAALLERLG
jgi:(1->4)-alpha-D-glucan 1-alpha-D-glucosylmutase